MHDLIPVLSAWADQKETFALATVIHTAGSSPRPVGSILAVNGEGKSVGSVSAGCVEGYVIERCAEAIVTEVAEICSFGASLSGEESVWDIGLSCHGKMEILITPITTGDTAFSNWIEQIKRGEEAIYWQPLPGTEATPDVSKSLDHLSRGTHFPLHNPSPDTLLVFGASHIAAPLIAYAKTAGMHTILVDPRNAFTSPERFPIKPDQLMQAWPSARADALPLTARTYAVILSHDAKLDDDALALLLPSQVAYIGALGSQSTHAERCERLSGSGFSKKQIQHIHGPIGLDIGAQTPAEIAASILAQIISVKRGGPRWQKTIDDACASA